MAQRGSSKVTSVLILQYLCISVTDRKSHKYSEREFDSVRERGRWVAFTNFGLSVDAKWLSIWHIIYCTNRECITWQVGAIIFLVLFGLQLKKKKKKIKILLSLERFPFFIIINSPQRQKSACSFSISVHFLDWFIDFFCSSNTEPLGSEQNCLQGFMASFRWMC